MKRLVARAGARAGVGAGVGTVCCCGIVLVASWLSLCSGTARAHDARPVFVQIHEKANGQLQMQWRVPQVLPPESLPRVLLPEHCTPVQEPYVRELADSWVLRQQFACTGDIAGATIRITYPLRNPSLSTLYRIEMLSGVVHTHLGGPDETSWTLPVQPSWQAVARDYTRLGIHHILLGPDHLLFVFCLLLIAGRTRRLLTAITGFTLAHSLTLALSTLDVVRVAVPPVEATIALSIVFLAMEIAQDDARSLTYRRPGLVAGIFGLLHGFGFASVLRGIGLPQTEVPTALLFFNIGVEIGQLLFVSSLLVLAWLGSRSLAALHLHGGVQNRIRQVATPAAVYSIGAVAAYRCIERTLGFWI